MQPTILDEIVNKIIALSLMPYPLCFPAHPRLQGVENLRRRLVLSAAYTHPVGGGGARLKGGDSTAQGNALGILLPHYPKP